MKHRIFFFIVFIQIVTNAWAINALINGLRYELSGSTATVIPRDNIYSPYSGAINIPSSIQYEGRTYNVKEIGPSAFGNCKMITSVTISEGIKKIGRCAFSKCSLESINIPYSVTTIGDDAFEGCSLINATIRCSNIVSYCFAGITTLKNVELDNTVTIIGIKAFSGCTNLASIIIPESVVSIGWRAFENCSSLTS